ncbi:MAG: polysaccharide pyruvyl transferase family protein [Candidatus Bathyarchaeota archaeon]|nr:polysaccharide pyruvyl transferase family protein [Candidatus Bathyarchaeota archaeon]
MVKIVILSANDTQNYGSAMMCINLIYYLSKKMGPNISFIVDALKENDIKRLTDETGNTPKILWMPTKRVHHKGQKLKEAMKEVRGAFLSAINILSLTPTCVIDVGGDNLGEYYYGGDIALNLAKVRLLSSRTPVFFAGQTIGPFYSWRKLIVGPLLSKCHIYARDRASYNYALNVLHCQNVIETRDLAFLDLPKQSNLNWMNAPLKKYGIKSNSYVTIVVSGLSHFYTSKRENYVRCWVRILENVATMTRLESYKLVLLPHVLTASHDDRKIIAQIKERMEKSLQDRFVFINDVLLPSEARSILGNGLFTITGRMHAAVSTLQMGKPALSISSSDKFDGVIKRGLNLDELVIDADIPSLWDSGEVVNILSGRVNYLLDNYENIIARILSAVKCNKERALTQIDSMADTLKELEN